MTIVRRSRQLLQEINAKVLGVVLNNVDTRQDPAANRRIKQWWAEVGIERLLHSEQGLFSYNLFSVSREDLGRRMTADDVKFRRRQFFENDRKDLVQKISDRVAVRARQRTPWIALMRLSYWHA